MLLNVVQRIAGMLLMFDGQRVREASRRQPRELVFRQGNLLTGPASAARIRWHSVGGRIVGCLGEDLRVHGVVRPAPLSGGLLAAARRAGCLHGSHVWRMQHGVLILSPRQGTMVWSAGVG